MNMMVLYFKKIGQVRKLKKRLNDIRELKSLYQSIDGELAIKEDKRKSRNNNRLKRALRVVSKKTDNNLFIRYPHLNSTRLAQVNKYRKKNQIITSK